MGGMSVRSLPLYTIIIRNATDIKQHDMLFVSYADNYEMNKAFTEYYNLKFPSIFKFPRPRILSKSEIPNNKMIKKIRNLTKSFATDFNIVTICEKDLKILMKKKVLFSAIIITTSISIFEIK